MGTGVSEGWEVKVGASSGRVAVGVGVIVAVGGASTGGKRLKTDWELF